MMFISRPCLKCLLVLNTLISKEMCAKIPNTAQAEAETFRLS